MSRGSGSGSGGGRERRQADDRVGRESAAGGRERAGDQLDGVERDEPDVVELELTAEAHQRLHERVEARLLHSAQLQTNRLKHYDMYVYTTCTCTVQNMHLTTCTV